MLLYAQICRYPRLHAQRREASVEALFPDAAAESTGRASLDHVPLQLPLFVL